ncbi:MAG: aromatic acid exporter family protein [Cellulosilyticum sp.]|nr:aromatic acid exporter family protein [Cellulosilyticum sp.]
MKKIIGAKTLKTAIGACLAMLIASSLEVKYSASAGIITILSIQNTRRESLQIAIRRLIATVVALFLGSCCFLALGFNAVSFAIYLLLFIPSAVKLKVTEGIVPASVLVTHLLGEGYIGGNLIINELLLMVIGAGIALLVNLYMPSLEESLLKEKKKIEVEMYAIFIKMEQALKVEGYTLDIQNELKSVKEGLQVGMAKATQYRNNSYIGKKSLYEKYFDMRFSQYKVMLYMQKHFERFYMVSKEAYKVADLTHQIALSVKGKVLVETLLEQVEGLRAYFKESRLPTSRDEFENRAMLYQFLTDVEQFLDIKKLFKEEMSEAERQEYMKYYDL